MKCFGSSLSLSLPFKTHSILVVDVRNESVEQVQNRFAAIQPNTQVSIDFYRNVNPDQRNSIEVCCHTFWSTIQMQGV